MAGQINDRNASLLSGETVDAASSEENDTPFDESLMKFITPFTMSVIGIIRFPFIP